MSSDGASSVSMPANVTVGGNLYLDPALCNTNLGMSAKQIFNLAAATNPLDAVNLT